MSKFLDAGIQYVSMGIVIVHDLIEISPDEEDGDESDKHIKARDRRYSCLISCNGSFKKNNSLLVGALEFSKLL